MFNQSSSIQKNSADGIIPPVTPSFEERQASFIDQSQPKSKGLFIWGVLVLSVFIIVTMIISTIFQHTLRERSDQMVLSVPSLPLERERQKQIELLHSYGMIDRQNNIVHIPIEEAMDKEVVSRKETLP